MEDWKYIAIGLRGARYYTQTLREAREKAGKVGRIYDADGYELNRAGRKKQGGGTVDPTKKGQYVGRRRGRAPVAEDQVAQIKAMYADGYRIDDICEQTGVGRATIYRYVKPKRRSPERVAKQQQRLPDEKIDRLQYLYDKGAPIREICEDLDISVRTVYRYVRSPDRQFPNKSDGGPRNERKVKRRPGRPSLNPTDVDRIVEMWNEGYRQIEIAKEIGIARQTVKKYLLERDVDLDAPRRLTDKQKGHYMSALGIPRKKARMDRDQEIETIRLYERGSRVLYIANSLGVSTATVYAVLRRNGVPLRAARRKVRNPVAATKQARAILRGMAIGANDTINANRIRRLDDTYFAVNGIRLTLKEAAARVTREHR